MKLAIYGTGGSGREVFDLLDQCPEEKSKWDDLIFIDDYKEEGKFRECKMLPYKAFREIFNNEDVKIVIAIGEPKDRKRIYDILKSDGFSLAKVIHSSAKISKYTNIADGCVIQEGVIISTDTILEENVYINHRSMIGHGVRIGSNSQISAGVMISGESVIGEGVFLGGGTCVRDHTNIGDYSIASMGSVILRNVPPYMIVMGNPARVIRSNDDETVFR